MGAEHSKASAKAVQMATMMIDENRVMLFSKSTDPYCMRIKSLLAGLGVNPAVCELDQEAEGEEIEDAVKDLSGYDTMPILFIGGHAVGTCDDIFTLHYNRELVPKFKAVGLQLQV